MDRAISRHEWDMAVLQAKHPEFCAALDAMCEAAEEIATAHPTAAPALAVDLERMAAALAAQDWDAFGNACRLSMARIEREMAWLGISPRRPISDLPK